MILTDLEIMNQIQKGNITIHPFDKDALGSNSYDVHLGSELLTLKMRREMRKERDNDNAYNIEIPPLIDCKRKYDFNDVDIIKIGYAGVMLEPGKLYLGSTVEYTETLEHIPFLEGKSSLGRLGLSVHVTAGKGDIGFKGNWTLEISVIYPTIIYAGMPIAQLIYFEKSGRVGTPYDKKRNAKYVNQPASPVMSQMYKNF